MSDEAPMSRLRASAHPVRLQILSLLTGAELSAAEVARELGLTHANASYHLRLLADAGLLEVAGEEKVRGGVAKRYRHPWADADVGEASSASEEDRLMFVRSAAEELVRRATVSEGRSVRRRPGSPRAYSADAEVWVEPAVWERVCALLREAGGLAHEQARTPRTPGTLHVNLTAFAFVMGEISDAEDAR